MQSLKWLVVIVVMFVLVTCEKDEDEYPNSLPAISIDWNSENSIVCLGTSITYGKRISFFEDDIDEGSRSGSDIDSTYPGLLGRELDLPVHNSGIPGARADHMITGLDTLLLNKNPALVLLETGANEFLRRDSVDVARTSIDSLINIIMANNIKIVLLSFTHPDMVNNTPEDHWLYSRSDLALEYFEMLQGVAERFELPIIDYIYEGVWGDDKKMRSDGIHPNNKGNAGVKENIFEAMYNTFDFNGMLKD